MARVALTNEAGDLTGNPAAWVQKQVPLAVHAGTANAVLLQDFNRRRPVVKTGGKPAVALRFDHGLANFRDLILPELRRLGLPCSLALNAGDWSRTENGGVTYSEVDGWVQNDQVEIWNHALNHVDVTDPADFETQIADGLTTLRSQLPSAVIDGFAPPGSGPYIDFNGGDSVESWWKTDAGRTILQHHAVAAGYIPGTVYRPLDGNPRHGLSHWTCDAQTSATVISWINAAYSGAQGVQLMLHPSRLNTTGYMTAADWTVVLEHIAAERDAGNLVVVGPYDMLRTDSTVTATSGGGTGPQDSGEVIANPPDVTKGNLFLRRIGNTVSLVLDGLAVPMDADGGIRSFTSIIPDGFQPNRFTYFETSRRASTSHAALVRVDPYGGMVAYDYNADSLEMYATVTYFTDDPFPTV